MNNRPEERAKLAFGMLAMSCDVHLDGVKREAMLKLIRAYGEARFEQGRERESQALQQMQMDLEVRSLSREFDRRKDMRRVSS